MLSKCANPACSTPFRYLRDGKLFEIEITPVAETTTDAKKGSRHIEFFWLCGSCSAQLTLVRDHEQGVRTVPIPKSAPFLVRRAVAS
jgi:hypothetical protein